MKKRAFPALLLGALKLIVLLAAGIALGFYLLVAVFALPVDKMEANVLASVPALDGTWGTGEEAYEQVIKGYESAQLDNTTDATMLLTAIHRSTDNLIDQAARVYTYSDVNSAGQYDTLLNLKAHGWENLDSSPYLRYWLGYLAVLKPLLLVFNYMDIRMLNTILQLALLFSLCLLLQRRGLTRYALPFALSLCCLTPAVTGFSLQFSTCFWVMGLSMLALLAKPKLVGRHEAAFFLLTGMLTSYVDFLTYPVITFGMPFLLWALTHESDGAKALWLRLLRCAAAWGLGYAGMWAGKWLIAIYLYGWDAFLWQIAGNIQIRMSAATTASGAGEIARLDAVGQNLSVFFKKPYLAGAVCTLLGYGIALCKNRKSRRPGSPAFYAVLLAVALLPLLWYVVTANHAFNHAFFTSRALTVSAFALLCAMARFTAAQE